MTTNQLNYLNIGLMFLSAGFAFVWSFETFLFVYAFLGPLHYLTEISWLHERQYFTQKRYDYLYLIIAAVLATLGGLELLPGLPKAFGEWISFLAFGMALAFVFLKTLSTRVGLAVLLLAACFFIGSAPWFMVIFGVFMPTLIHVSIFMMAFMLWGAMKDKAISGYLALLVFTALSLGFFLLHPDHPGYQVSSYIADNYGTVKSDGTLSAPFLSVNFFFAKWFHLDGFTNASGDTFQYSQTLNQYFYHHPMALALMGFIAFSYMYQYLNWFSKTSIIGWNKVPLPRLIVVGVLWAVSILLYIVNYEMGIRWLFFLSLAHVLLEFPLNHLTFTNIGKSLIGKAWRGSNTAS